MKEICPKCPHRKTCKTPCYPVRLYLAQDNLTVFEKSHTDADGKTVTIMFGRSRETPESMLTLRQDPDFEPEEVPRAFSTDNESPFASFKPKLKLTGVFVDRFFHNWTYKDLAVKYSVSLDTARKIYHRALQRLYVVLEAMDDTTKYRNLEHRIKQVAERSGTLNKGQRWFLLNKLFGLRPSEIAQMDHVKHPSAVRQLIIRVSDQLKAGEISLIDCTPQDAREAKARLETHRAKRRERYAGTKS